MGYRQRIEKAVKDMFTQDREFEAKLNRIFCHEEIINAIDYLGNCDIALDLLGIPADNTLDYDLNDPKYRDEWPKGCFCRDYFHTLWYEEAKEAQEFLDYCYEVIKNRAEEETNDQKKD